jgi:predicted nucleotidyltransferase
MSEKYLEIAKNYLSQNYPDAECAFVAGSIMRGEGKPHSDIDLVVIYGDAFDTVRRESKIFETVPIESFVHNEKSLKYFINLDVDGGVPSMPSMVSEGLIIGSNKSLAMSLKAYAQEVIAKGPKPLDKAAMLRARYGLTDLLDDIRDERPYGEYIGCVSEIYKKLGDFYLRSKCRWSGSGKGLIKQLNNIDSKFAKRYEMTFKQAFEGDKSQLEKLIIDVLEPHGGIFWDGDYQLAPKTWQ